MLFGSKDSPRWMVGAGGSEGDLVIINMIIIIMIIVIIVIVITITIIVIIIILITENPLQLYYSAD